jgi:hypothetical protein
MHAESRSVSRTFDLPSIGPKTYAFPTVFEDVQAFAALAFVPSEAAAAWVASPLEVVQLPGKRTLAMVTFQDLRRPAQMAPYVEASLAVLTRAPSGARAFHVLTMPVTSSENHARGNFIFGYPKEMADIAVNVGERAMSGEVRIDGKVALAASVGGGLPIHRRVSLKSRHLQILRGDLVSIATRVRAVVRPTRGTIEVGTPFTQRWPGLPERLRAHLALRLVDARFELDLPQNER